MSEKYTPESLAIPTYPKPEIRDEEELRETTFESCVSCYGTEFALRTGAWTEDGKRWSYYKGEKVQGEPIRDLYQKRIDEDENFANWFYASAIESRDKKAGHGWILPWEDASKIEVWTQEDGDWEEGGTFRTVYEYATGKAADR